MKQSAARNVNTGRWSESNIERGGNQGRQRKKTRMTAIEELVVAAWVMGLMVGSWLCRVHEIKRLRGINLSPDLLIQARTPPATFPTHSFLLLFFYCRTLKYFEAFIFHIVPEFLYKFKLQGKGLVLWSRPFVVSKASRVLHLHIFLLWSCSLLVNQRIPLQSSSFMWSFSLSLLQKLCKWNQSRMSSIKRAQLASLGSSRHKDGTVFKYLMQFKCRWPLQPDAGTSCEVA